MTQLVIDNLDDEVRGRLQSLAQEHGGSVEDEISVIFAVPSNNRLTIGAKA